MALATFLGGPESQEAHYKLRKIIPTDTSIMVDDALAQAQMDTMKYTSIVQPLQADMVNFWTPVDSMGMELVAGSVTHENAAEVTGVLQNIPQEIYEAARMDGAGPVKIFFQITLPYMLFVTTPYLIVSFVNNINNFNVIYLLSGGGPTMAGDTAGQTDLLVTWLYKLTIDQQYYNIGAVIGIMTFVILTVVTLATYRNSNSYKNEEAFM